MAYKDIHDPRNKAAKLKHYYANKQQYLDRNAKAKADKRAWIKAKKNVPCMDCGKSYPFYVMDFDHRDPSIKVANIGRLIGSWKKLKEEVEKCDIVCSNCHRIRTHSYLDTDEDLC